MSAHSVLVATVFCVLWMIVDEPRQPRPWKKEAVATIKSFATSEVFYRPSCGPLSSFNATCMSKEINTVSGTIFYDPLGPDYMLTEAAFDVFGISKVESAPEAGIELLAQMKGGTWFVPQRYSGCPNPPSQKFPSMPYGHTPYLDPKYKNLEISATLFSAGSDTNFCITELAVKLTGVLVNPDIYDYKPKLLIRSGSDIKRVEISGFNFGRRTWVCFWRVPNHLLPTPAIISVYDPRVLFCPIPDEIYQNNQTTELTLHDDDSLGNEPNQYGPFVLIMYDAPEVISVKPTNGSESGGTTVTIKGHKFLNEAGVVVMFGRVQAQHVKVIDADTIECVTPAYVPSSDPDLNATVADIEATKEKASKISISLDGGHYFSQSEVKFFYYYPFNPMPGPPSPVDPLEWLRSHIYVPILGAIGVVGIIMISCWIATSLRRDDGYVELAQVAQDQDLGASVVIKEKDIVLKKRIGRGQFSDVYNGIYRYTEVAVKRLRQVEDAAVVEELVKEAKVMHNLRHPNVVAFMGICCLQDKDLCLITEYLPRGSLYDVLVNSNIKVERRMCLDCCCGMDYLHSKNLIHRDLKPKNLLVAQNWEVKVGDFGLSKFLEEKLTNHTLTACGTPVFAAPEVLLQEKYSFKADVYSFSMVLYEIWISTTPWRNMNPYRLVIEVAKKGRRPEIKNDVSVPAEIANLIRACWDESPEARPSFSDLILALRAVALDPPTSPAPVVTKVAMQSGSVLTFQTDSRSNIPGSWNNGLSNSSNDSNTKFLYRVATNSPSSSASSTANNPGTTPALESKEKDKPKDSKR